MLNAFAHSTEMLEKMIQWHPAITKCQGTEKDVRYSEDPVTTNYLVNNKNVRYSWVTILNQAEQWDIQRAKQSTDLRNKDGTLIPTADVTKMK